MKRKSATKEVFNANAVNDSVRSEIQEYLENNMITWAHQQPALGWIFPVLLLRSEQGSQ